MFEIRLKSRMIGPAFLQSESLAKVPFATRIFFVGLWMVTELTPHNPEALRRGVEEVLDINGRPMGLLIDKPEVLISQLFPYDRKLNADKMLQQLHDIGAIVRYEADGYKCIWVPGFKKMQAVHPRERMAKIPPPSKEIQEKHAEQNNHIESPKELIKPADDIPYQEIIDDLNKKRKAKKPFTVTAGVKKLINGRWGEGFKLEDFFYVHTVKCDEWLGGDAEKYIRPITLYNANKFQGYINQRSPKAIENEVKFSKMETCPECENVGPIVEWLADVPKAKEATGMEPILKNGTVSMQCAKCKHKWLII